MAEPTDPAVARGRTAEHRVALGVLCLRHAGSGRGEVVDERGPPLALGPPVEARVDHEERLGPGAGGGLGRVGQFVFHTAVHVQRSAVVLAIVVGRHHAFNRDTLTALIM